MEWTKQAELDRIAAGEYDGLFKQWATWAVNMTRLHGQGYVLEVEDVVSELKLKALVVTDRFQPGGTSSFFTYLYTVCRRKAGMIVSLTRERRISSVSWDDVAAWSGGAYFDHLHTRLYLKEVYARLTPRSRKVWTALVNDGNKSVRYIMDLYVGGRTGRRPPSGIQRRDVEAMLVEVRALGGCDAA
jgi:DNA-directed RNA polymerase specialized sigma24 family protein